MTSAREDALNTGAVGPGERSVVRSLRGLRWWATLLLGAVFTTLGIAVDLIMSGELGVVFTASFAGGCILATAWSRRDSLFLPLVQPPLLLAVGVPVVVVASGSLPRSGGTASTLLAVGGPLVNAFPTLAITTAVCLALGFVRTRLEPWQKPGDDLDPDDPPGRAPRDPRDRERDLRERERRERETRERQQRESGNSRDRDARDSRAPRDRDARDARDARDRDRRDRDARDARDRGPRQVPVEARPARDERRRPAGGDPRRRAVRPDDPDEEFGPGVRRVPRRVDGPDDRR